jgi:signal transduction histidine kinase
MVRRASDTWLLMATAALAVGIMAALTFFYIRMQQEDPAVYLRNEAGIRQLKQLDATWELDVMKSRTGISANYDALVDTLSRIASLHRTLRASMLGGTGRDRPALVAADVAYARAIVQKSQAIESFKSHNSVLHNSLSFLPTAAQDASGGAPGGHQAPNGAVPFLADAILLDTMVYSQAPTDDARSHIEIELRGLELSGIHAPPARRDSIAIFAAHARSVLREQMAVDNLLRAIAAAPTNARIDALDHILVAQQTRIGQNADFDREFLENLALALVVLLGIAAVRLVRNHRVINRINRELSDANTGLEKRVQERTNDLLRSNTELRASEARLALQASELAAARDMAEASNGTKSAFLANMSHELRTPLNAIIGFAELMRTSLFGPLGNSRYESYVKDIHDSGSHLLALINDILDLSRLDAGKADLVETEFSVEVLAAETCRSVQPMADRICLRLDMELARESAGLRADRRRVKQVLLNLLSNAIKFTPERGMITLKAQIVEGGVQLEVRDTGIGMSETELPKALERFGQVDSSIGRKYQGTGLGLPLTKQLVEIHGGTFEIHSVTGQGTSVKLTFPPERTVAFAGALISDDQRKAIASLRLAAAS